MCAARQITPTPPTYHRTVDEPRGIATLLEDPAEAHLGLRLLGRGILLRVCEGEQGGGKEEGKEALPWRELRIQAGENKLLRNKSFKLGLGTLN